MNKVILSVIIPVYNVESYIGQCLRSILEYKEPDLEVICVNDGSTDNSWNKMVAFRDDRMHFFSQKNQGPSVARNKGMEYTTGRYFMFVDADDWLEPGSIGKIIAILKQPNMETLFFNMSTWHKNKLKVKEKLPFPAEYSYNTNDRQILERVLLTSFIFNSPCGKIYDSKIIKKYNIRFPENVKFGEDSLFNNQYFLHSKHGFYYNQFLYVYRRSNAASLTRRSDIHIFKDFSMLYTNRLSLFKNVFLQQYPARDEIKEQIEDIGFKGLYHCITNAKLGHLKNRVILDLIESNPVLAPLQYLKYRKGQMYIKQFLVRHRLYGVMYILNMLKAKISFIQRVGGTNAEYP